MTFRVRRGTRDPSIAPPRWSYTALVKSTLTGPKSIVASLYCISASRSADDGLTGGGADCGSEQANRTVAHSSSWAAQGAVIRKFGVDPPAEADKAKHAPYSPRCLATLHAGTNPLGSSGVRLRWDYSRARMVEIDPLGMPS